MSSLDIVRILRRFEPARSDKRSHGWLLCHSWRGQRLMPANRGAERESSLRVWLLELRPFTTSRCESGVRGWTLWVWTTNGGWIVPGGFEPRGLRSARPLGVESDSDEQRSLRSRRVVPGGFEPPSLAPKAVLRTQGLPPVSLPGVPSSSRLRVNFRRRHRLKGRREHKTLCFGVRPTYTIRTK
jgi:hypothetical protein